MIKRFFMLAALSILCLGCVPTAETGGDSDSGGEVVESADAPPTGSDGKSAEAGTGNELNPENTTIQFVGAHTDKSKDDRVGKFEKFEGTVQVAAGKLASVLVKIETASLSTAMDKLTEHLLGPDFFNVREYPAAEFTSTAIDEADGAVTITGDLTLLGVTKSISFPAEVTTDGSGIELTAEFEIDRTEFGMDYSVDSIEKMVAMTINVKG